MEVGKNSSTGWITVYLNKEESETIDRSELTKILLRDQKKGCKVVYFLSGSSSLFDCTESLVLNNLKN